MLRTGTSSCEHVAQYQIAVIAVSDFTSYRNKEVGKLIVSRAVAHSKKAYILLTLHKESLMRPACVYHTRSPHKSSNTYQFHMTVQ